MRRALWGEAWGVNVVGQRFDHDGDDEEKKKRIHVFFFIMVFFYFFFPSYNKPENEQGTRKVEKKTLTRLEMEKKSWSEKRIFKNRFLENDSNRTGSSWGEGDRERSIPYRW